MNNWTLTESAGTGSYSFAGQSFTVTSFDTESEVHIINLNFSEEEMRQFLESLGYKERTAKIYPDNGTAYLTLGHGVKTVDEYLKGSNFGQIYGLVPTFEHEFKKHLMESPKSLSKTKEKNEGRIRKLEFFLYGALKKLGKQETLDLLEMEYFELTKDK